MGEMIEGWRVRAYEAWHQRFHIDCSGSPCDRHFEKFLDRKSNREFTEVIVAANMNEARLYRTATPLAVMISGRQRMLGLRIDVVYWCGRYWERADLAQIKYQLILQARRQELTEIVRNEP